MARKGKRKKQASGLQLRMSPWWLAGIVAVGGIAVVVVLIVTSGSSGVSGPADDVGTEPDPRVAGLTPVETIEVEAGGEVNDAYFSPNRITGPAGEPFEIVVENVGPVGHQLTVAGVDGEYNTSDDWSTGNVIDPGEEGSVVVLINAPGTYAFRCALHPLTQTGELTLQ